MDDLVRTTLRAIGAQLDANQFPVVHNDGIVVPSGAPVVQSRLGTEISNASFGQTRPSARPWSGAASRQGTSRRPWPPRPAASATLQRYRATYEAHLDDVWSAYPRSRVWAQEEGMWLLTDSAVLDGLMKSATFLLALPFDPRVRVRSWGFWTTIVGVSWIGPRHTNWPDGDICAFTSIDRTWRPGESLVKLLDINTLWALRHLHLEAFDRWPGYQSAPHPYERMIELRDDEYCGCDNSCLLYGDCCKPRDLQLDRAAIISDFMAAYLGGGQRSPPSDIVRFVRARFDPPPIANFSCLS